MGSLGPSELLIIFMIVLLLFGAKKLPELARGLGRGIREFQNASREIQDEITKAEYEPPRHSQQTQTTQHTSTQTGPESAADDHPDPEEENLD